MRLGPSTAGSFYTVDGIKFVCEHRKDADICVVWNGGVRGGEVFHYHRVSDTDRHYNINRGGRKAFKSLDLAARESIKRIRQEVAAARKLIFDYESAEIMARLEG